MARKDHLDHLRNVPLFRTFGQRDLQKIARASDEVALPAGATIVDQGKTGTEAFVLLEGTATVRRSGRKVATLGPGAVIGELALLDRGPRTATVTADSDVRLLIIDARHFGAVLEEVPGLAQRLLGVLATRVRDLDKAVYG